MSFQDLISQAQSAVSILSNPSQSSVAAAGAAGAFSAEINNLRQVASVDLQNFGSQVPSILQPYTNKIFGTAQSVLAGSPSNPIPANPSGTIFGVSYLTAILVGIVAVLGLVFWFGRRSS